MWFLDFRYLTDIFLAALVAYFAVVIILRVFGKRSLAKWNMFDFVVTIALGSTLATAVMSTGDNGQLRKGLFGFLFLTGLQFVVTWLSVRFEWIANLLKSQPTLVVQNGRWLEAAMRRQRLTKSEVLAAMRASGTNNLSEIGAVVLETNGELSVLKKWETESIDSLSDVSGYENSTDSHESNL